MPNFNSTSFTQVPVRFFTHADPYHYTIDNRPLTDLNANISAFASFASSMAQYATTKFFSAADCGLITSGSGVSKSNSAVHGYDVVTVDDGVDGGVCVLIPSDFSFDLSKPIRVKATIVGSSAGVSGFKATYRSFVSGASDITAVSRVSTAPTSVTIPAPNYLTEVTVTAAIPVSALSGNSLIEVGIVRDSTDANAGSIEILNMTVFQ